MVFTILRGFTFDSDKLGGVLAMGGAIVMILIMPWLNTSEVRSSAFRPIYRKTFLFIS